MAARAILVAVLAVFAFAFVLWRADILSIFRKLTSQTFDGISAMFDKTLDDKAKERAVRRSGGVLLLGAGHVILVFALSIVATLVPIYLSDFTGLAPAERSIGMLLRPDFILAVSIFAIAASFLFSKLRPRQMHDVSDGHGQSVTDKIVHTLAFAGRGTLRVAGNIDDRYAASRIADIELDPPIFVTSLARGGTTALLNALHTIPGLVTHLYRDMPFITAPLLWSRLGSRRAVERRKRAHGDGLEIDLDTAEAFEEVLWMLYWPEKLLDHGIEVFGPDDAKSAAQDFILRHFKKIAYLRGGGTATSDGHPYRYLSKNNGNIARLALLPEMFPGCDIVVPIRRPAAHSASLMRQHENFLQLHRNDRFVMKYMRDIGHFEFGELHRPILFGGKAHSMPNPNSPDYWLTYWISAFREVRRHADRVVFVAQDDLRESPQKCMMALIETLGVSVETDFTSFFHGHHDDQPRDLFSRDILAEAENLYDELARDAVR